VKPKVMIFDLYKYKCYLLIIFQSDIFENEKKSKRKIWTYTSPTMSTSPTLLRSRGQRRFKYSFFFLRTLWDTFQGQNCDGVQAPKQTIPQMHG